MKYLFLILLLSGQAYSATIGQYVSHPDGSSFQSFNLEKNKVIYEKHSNFFDKKKDLTLGHFELAKKSDVAQLRRAARLTAFMARALNTNTSMAPTRPPTNTAGLPISTRITSSDVISIPRACT